MSVLINFKICDNAEECEGIEACPTSALSWDNENKTIKIDNDKCISCGLCESACDVGAIEIANNQEEYKKIEKEIEEDPRTKSDLYIDRYGAQPIGHVIREEQFADQILSYPDIAVAEIFKNDTIECMIKSIPIKELFKDIEIKYRKVELTSNALLDEYQINKLPALVFFKDGKLLGKIEGYYTTDQIDNIEEKIDKIIQK